MFLAQVIFTSLPLLGLFIFFFNSRTANKAHLWFKPKTLKFHCGLLLWICMSIYSLIMLDSPLSSIPVLFSHINIHSTMVHTYRWFKFSWRRYEKLLRAELMGLCKWLRERGPREAISESLKRNHICCVESSISVEAFAALLTVKGKVLHHFLADKLKWVTDLFLPSVSVSLALPYKAHSSPVMWCIQMLG